LTSITIPGSLTCIGPKAFCNCSKLSSVTYLGDVDTPYIGAFSECPMLKYICVIDEYPDSTFCGIPAKRNCDQSSSFKSSSQSSSQTSSQSSSKVISQSSSSSSGKPNPLPGNASTSSFVCPSVMFLGLIFLLTYQIFVF